MSEREDCVARNKLKAWVSVEGRTKAAVARLLNVSQPSVNAWVNGGSRPEPHLRQALSELTGIPTEEWDYDSEREQRDAAIERIKAASSLDPEAA